MKKELCLSLMLLQLLMPLCFQSCFLFTNEKLTQYLWLYVWWLWKRPRLSFVSVVLIVNASPNDVAPFGPIRLSCWMTEKENVLWIIGTSMCLCICRNNQSWGLKLLCLSVILRSYISLLHLQFCWLLFIYVNKKWVINECHLHVFCLFYSLCQVS